MLRRDLCVGCSDRARNEADLNERLKAVNEQLRAQQHAKGQGDMWEARCQDLQKEKEAVSRLPLLPFPASLFITCADRLPLLVLCIRCW